MLDPCRDKRLRTGYRDSGTACFWFATRRPAPATTCCRCPRTPKCLTISSTLCPARGLKSATKNSSTSRLSWSSTKSTTWTRPRSSSQPPGRNVSWSHTTGPHHVLPPEDWVIWVNRLSILIKSNPLTGLSNFLVQHWFVCHILDKLVALPLHQHSQHASSALVGSLWRVPANKTAAKDANARLCLFTLLPCLLTYN